MNQGFDLTRGNVMSNPEMKSKDRLLYLNDIVVKGLLSEFKGEVEEMLVKELMEPIETEIRYRVMKRLEQVTDMNIEAMRDLQNMMDRYSVEFKWKKDEEDE